MDYTENANACVHVMSESDGFAGQLQSWLIQLTQALSTTMLMEIYVKL